MRRPTVQQVLDLEVVRSWAARLRLDLPNAPTRSKSKSKENIQYAYHSRIGVTTLTPSRGSLQGGTNVILHGTGFVNASRLSCRFDNVIVLATYLSEISISCTTPGSLQG